ncbi:MAG: uL15 family ribosomal protein [Candidatus Paceibacterota bacterium]|jgi:large subunit ribosomal protein L15
MQTHELKRNPSNRKSQQVGRGSKRGKTSGRGTKGQKARAGHKIRPMMRDIIKKLPKRRGRGIHPNKPVMLKGAAVVNVGILLKVKGTPITPDILVSEGIVRRIHGRVPSVKILGGGVIDKAVQIVRCVVSESARKKIEAAGGSIK